MVDEEKRASRRAPVVLRIKLRYPNVDAFIQRFATNLSSGGMFISSRAPKPKDTKVKFEIRLADDLPIISGTGVVRWTRAYDSKNPRRLHGMGIEFTRLDNASRVLIARVVDHRRSLGLPDDEKIPFPGRRSTTADATAPAAPAGEADSAAHAAESEPAPAPEQATPAAAPTAGPEAATATAPAARRPPPPPPPSPVAVERERPPRVSAAELVARATATAPSTESWSREFEEALGTEMPNLAAALARARALARGNGEHDVDDELKALLETDAVPLVATADEASAKLASILGGSAVVTRPYPIPLGAIAPTAKAEPAPVPAPVPVPVPVPAAETAAEPEAEAEPEAAAEPEAEAAAEAAPEPEAEAAPEPEAEAAPEPEAEAAPEPEAEAAPEAEAEAEAAPEPEAEAAPEPEAAPETEPEPLPAIAGASPPELMPFEPEIGPAALPAGKSRPVRIATPAPTEGEVEDDGEITSVRPPSSPTNEGDEATRPSGLSDLLAAQDAEEAELDLGPLADGLSDEPRDEFTGEKLSHDLNAGVLNAEDLLASGVDRLMSTRRPTTRRAPTPPLALPAEPPDLASFADPPDLPEMARSTSGEVTSGDPAELDEIDAALAALEIDVPIGGGASPFDDQPADASAPATDDDDFDIDLDLDDDAVAGGEATEVGDAEDSKTTVEKPAYTGDLDELKTSVAQKTYPGDLDELKTSVAKKTYPDDSDDAETSVAKKSYPDLKVTVNYDGFETAPPELVDPNDPNAVPGDEDADAAPKKKGLFKRWFGKKPKDKEDEPE